MDVESSESIYISKDTETNQEADIKGVQQDLFPEIKQEGQEDIVQTNSKQNGIWSYMPLGTDETSENYRRKYTVLGRTVSMNSGHAYNRAHKSGKIAELETEDGKPITMDEAENAILCDVKTKLENKVQIKNEDCPVCVRGANFKYRIYVGEEMYCINYFPG